MKTTPIYNKINRILFNNHKKKKKFNNTIIKKIFKDNEAHNNLNLF